MTCDTIITRYLNIEERTQFVKRKGMNKNKNKEPEFAENIAEESQEKNQDLAAEPMVEENLEENAEMQDFSQIEKDNIEALRLENAHLKDEYLRALAESENTKKRCAQEIEKNNKYAISSFAKNLLSVADNLHRAIEAAAQNAENCQDLLKGVEMTEAELMKVFNKHGITKMEVMDKHFDPNFHQVIQEVEDKSKPNGTVIAELQTGYMINDRILREAMVVVSKGGE